MIMDIPNLIAMFSTIGNLSQVIELNAGFWVNDVQRNQRVTGRNLGELFIQTADVKLNNIISLYNELGPDSFIILITNFYSHSRG